MHIAKVEVKNFRLLQSVSLVLEPTTTVVVGRNNSGKTSLTELFRRLLAEKSPVFALEDFSLSVHDFFWEAFSLHKAGSDETEVRAKLPVIEAQITIEYDDQSTDLGSLSSFIIDLDPECNSVIAVIRYQLSEGHIEALFDGLSHNPETPEEPQKRELCSVLKERVPKLYKVALLTVDPADAANVRPLEWSHLQSVLRSGFVNAQRGLDDETHREKDVLGKILSSLFNTASSPTADNKDKDTVQRLEAAVKDIRESLDKQFNNELKNIVPTLSLFGYPGLSAPNLLTETTLDVQRLLANNTRIRYAGSNGVNLPETFNGLGTRNLIYILLRLLEFFKAYQAESTRPAVHLVFIEEPEAHLHPQMQEVFVRQLSAIATQFASDFNNGTPWPVQFVISTHSSHIANEAPFQAIRYFLTVQEPSQGNHLSTKIKDLRQGLGSKPKENRKFLHQYMTLTRCDLLFADKAVLIEGTTERLMLPKLIEKTDQAHSTSLASQYLTVMEVDGAYAHKFFDLLNFLELRTLIITDLDSVDEDGEACKVADGVKTSNACIKDWFNEPTVSPASLIAKTEAQKTKKKLRLAYEILEAEDGPCGRSFEDMFMLANPALFSIQGATTIDQANDAWGKASKIKNAKTSFALKYALEELNWAVPKYLSEGLQWLADSEIDLASIPAPITADCAISSEPTEAAI